MKMKNVIAVTILLAATAAQADDRRFVASDVKGAGLKKPGKVVISNDARSITAHRFFGNIREALVTLRSRPVRGTSTFGGVVFDPTAGFAAPKHLTSYIKEAAQAHNVDPRLVAAVMRRESAWNDRAVSRAGACGLMQLMPATAKFLGVTDIFDVRENIFGGTRYLRTLLDTFNGDVDLALAAYNAGPGAVEKYRGVPPYRETKAYVAAVRSTYEAALRQ
jgi:soluble lytic murein transglycosylase-like protein